MLHSYAQTNIQLFNQLRAEGYSSQEVSRLRAVYEFALHLFTGRYQPCGKPFLDHLIGTASILASLQRPIAVVVAGLMHAAYMYGDFGSPRRSMTRGKRRQIRRTVGEEIEAYIARYTALRWTGETIPIIWSNLTALDALDREVLLMRLANELELHLDLGALCCCNAESYQRTIAHHGTRLQDMANSLGFPVLASELARVFQETITGEISAELRNRSNQPHAYLVAPPSYRERFTLVVWKWFRQLPGVHLALQRTLRVAGMQLQRQGTPANSIPPVSTSGARQSLPLKDFAASPGFSSKPSEGTPHDNTYLPSSDARLRKKSATHSYAQTIPQLYSQLQRNGYSVADECRIRDAYESAMARFSGCFQPSGKLLIAHVVGTASILASLRLPVEVVVAGLLHNLYQNGDFGDGRQSLTTTRRDQVQRLIGTDAEQYVARFATLPWNSQAIAAIRAQPHALGPLDCHTVLLRLADQLEHLLDRDLLYSNEVGRRLYTESAPAAAAIAEQFGFSSLASDLRQALQEYRQGDIPPELRIPRKQDFAFVLAPRSHRKRLSVEVRRLSVRGFNWLRSFARSSKLRYLRVPIGSGKKPN
jgi:hypothetical protein